MVFVDGLELDAEGHQDENLRPSIILPWGPEYHGLLPAGLKHRFSKGLLELLHCELELTHRLPERRLFFHRTLPSLNFASRNSSACATLIPNSVKCSVPTGLRSM